MNKRIKMLSFIIVIVIIGVLGVVIYSNATKDNEKTIEDKVLSETQYLEVKVINMANRINNVTTQNYKVTTKQVDDSSGTGDTSSNSAESGQESQSQGNGGSSNQEGNNDKNSSNQKKEQYDMERINNLSKDRQKEINWDDIQKEIEEIYTVIPTITLDIYQTNINQEDILKLNRYLDELSKEAKDKKENETLSKLCNIYYCISKFIENVSKDEVYKATIKAKESVLIAYSRINEEKWDEANKEIQNGIDKFSSLLTNTNVNYDKQLNVNKIYVILNEIKNVIEKEDKDVFLIKYKNLLEEMNGI